MWLLVLLIFIMIFSLILFTIYKSFESKNDCEIDIFFSVSQGFRFRFNKYKNNSNNNTYKKDPRNFYQE